MKRLFLSAAAAALISFSASVSAWATLTTLHPIIVGVEAVLPLPPPVPAVLPLPPPTPAVLPLPPPAPAVLPLPPPTPINRFEDDPAVLPLPIPEPFQDTYELYQCFLHPDAPECNVDVP